MSLKRKPPAGNVRRVRSNGHNLCGVITNKAGRLVQFESWLERALILRLDRDPEVLDYQSQPERFEFVDEQGQKRAYTPDFKVWRQDGRIEIHEVTLSRRRVRSNMRQRERAGRELCQARGWHYVVHIEQNLPDSSELANLLALAGYRPRSYANQAVTQAVYDSLSAGKPLEMQELVGQIKQALNLPEGRITAGLCHLLWHSELATDFNQLLFDQGAIVPDVRVWLTPKEGNDGSPII